MPCVYIKGIDVFLLVSCTQWLILSMCIIAVCVCLCVFVRMFVWLKGLAQSRPFVVGSSGHSAQLVWFMDVSQDCISLRPEKDCPSSWCESNKCGRADSIKQKLIQASNLSDTYLMLSVHQ